MVSFDTGPNTILHTVLVHVQKWYQTLTGTKFCSCGCSFSLTWQAFVGQRLSLRLDGQSWRLEPWGFSEAQPDAAQDAQPGAERAGEQHPKAPSLSLSLFPSLHERFPPKLLTWRLIKQSLYDTTWQEGGEEEDANLFLKSKKVSALICRKVLRVFASFSELLSVSFLCLSADRTQ